MNLIEKLLQVDKEKLTEEQTKTYNSKNMERQDLEASLLCDELADNLSKFGFSLEEIEALELEAYDEREKELEKFDKEHPNWEQLINA